MAVLALCTVLVCNPSCASETHKKIVWISSCAQAQKTPTAEMLGIRDARCVHHLVLTLHQYLVMLDTKRCSGVVRISREAIPAHLSALCMSVHMSCTVT